MHILPVDIRAPQAIPLSRRQTEAIEHQLLLAVEHWAEHLVREHTGLVPCPVFRAADLRTWKLAMRKTRWRRRASVVSKRFIMTSHGKPIGKPLTIRIERDWHGRIVGDRPVSCSAR